MWIGERGLVTLTQTSECQTLPDLNIESGRTKIELGMFLFEQYRSDDLFVSAIIAQVRHYATHMCGSFDNSAHAVLKSLQAAGSSTYNSQLCPPPATVQ